MDIKIRTVNQRTNDEVYKVKYFAIKGGDKIGYIRS